MTGRAGTAAECVRRGRRFLFAWLASAGLSLSPVSEDGEEWLSGWDPEAARTTYLGRHAGLPILAACPVEAIALTTTERSAANSV
jgi:hypothetical protein